MQYENAAYDIGADMRISGLDFGNSTIMNVINDVDGIQSTSVVKLFQTDAQSQNEFKFYQVLGVNTSTFASTAFWMHDYASHQLDDLIDNIQQNNSVLLQENNANALNLHNKDQYIIYNDPNSTETTVSGTFEYFPNFIDWKPSGSYDIYMVVSLETFAILKSRMGASYEESTLYLNLKNNANQTAIAEAIFDGLAEISQIGQIDFIDERVESLEGDLLINTFVSITQSLLFITFLSSIVAISYFSFITLADRRREIGIFRALGMIKSQLFRLLIVESLLIIFASFIFGSSLGMLLTDFLLSLFVISDAVPPFRIFYNWPILSVFGILLVMFGVLAAYYPARREANKQTGSVLRAE
jgi:ABC-type lipoprotein release transport system permease subunit